MASPSRHIGASRLLPAIKSLEEKSKKNADSESLRLGFELLKKEMDLVSNAIEDHLNEKSKLSFH